MSKTEKFISDCTRNCSNKVCYEEGIGNLYEAWLTPEQAKGAVEIAKEEITEKACDAYCKVCGHYAHTTPTYICRKACDYYKKFKNYMKGK